jgi:RimJ/RimL family protein N-acetyltransferase
MVQTLIAFGFDKMKLARIEAVCPQENVASRGVLLKAGCNTKGCCAITKSGAASRASC